MMSKHSRRELLLAVAPRYRTARRAERKQILDEFVASTGYHRKYALHLLLKHPLTREQPPKKSKGRPRHYGFAV